MSVKPFVIAMVLVAPFAAQAQRAPGSDTVLKGSTIEVIQSYKPKVKQSPKPEWIPQLPPADTSHPAFTYDVPQQTLNYTYNSLPLRPLALGRNPDPLPYQNYVKAGGGNLSTIYLDAGIGGIHGDDYETAIHLHHISQKGSIKNQSSSLSGIEADGVLHHSSGDWHAAISGERNQYYYYGYDHILHDYNAEDVKQTYTGIHASVDMQNRADSATKLSYHPAVNASYYDARYNTSEFTVGFNAPLTYKLDKTVDLKLALDGALTRYKADTVSTGNNFIQLMPGVDIHGRQFRAHALVGFALGMGGSGYILPDLLASYTLPGTKVSLEAGYKARLLQNTYEQLTTENPYMLNRYNVLQGRSDEVFAGLQGSVGSHFSFTGRASWWSYNTLPTFLNDTGDQKQLYVQYQNANAISVKIGVRYHVANSWSAGITGDYYSYYNIQDIYSTAQAYVWHQPALRIKGDLMLHPLPKLTATAYIAVLGGIHARDITYAERTLKAAADIGLSGEYQIIPRLSAFLQVNNLLNNKYERWLGYQAYGINIYGGVRLKF